MSGRDAGWQIRRRLLNVLLPPSTSRLVPRELTFSDTDNLLRILSDPVAMKHYPQTYDREATEGWIQRGQDRYTKDGHSFYAWDLKESGEFAGICGLLKQEIDGVPELEVGYLFRRDLWNRGLATEAARECRDHGFRTYPVPHIISIIDPNNVQSIRVAEKNGMTPWKMAMFKGSLDRIYRVTREEWVGRLSAQAEV